MFTIIRAEFSPVYNWAEKINSFLQTVTICVLIVTLPMSTVKDQMATQCCRLSIFQIMISFWTFNMIAKSSNLVHKVGYGGLN